MQNSPAENSGNAAAFSRTIIYDLGANNGGDIPYYLRKADLVVAVEANPALCVDLRQRFSAELAADRLRIENCVLVAASDDAHEVPFYLHKRHHVLGQFPQPDESVIDDYDRVTLPAQSVLAILQRHGPPHYIKLDIEGYDEVILSELLRNGIRPPYLSAESSSIRVFTLLSGLGGYSAFQLVEGKTVAENFRNHPIHTRNGPQAYSFPQHSAGPFGDDLPGPWLNADNFLPLLAAKGMGWRDIHVTSLVQPDPTSHAQQRRRNLRHLRGWLRAKFHRGPALHFVLCCCLHTFCAFPSHASRCNNRCVR
ncbi:MAG TPA: FkbM family methyltransferase [Terracidiphilus sp.]|nr:FkbM family methyltransferase [Terracidiphilus sp.]